ncbi:hypothetical protein [Scytonema sp. HK-05]|uniref:hypothetical protein n=1 Tax=Scytonema sp. HK-05 TaxID=1137095 RepID=UPI001E488EEB|nr:hypothetical protein [Scytonema sp. HK-05]
MSFVQSTPKLSGSPERDGAKAPESARWRRAQRRRRSHVQTTVSLKDSVPP